MSNPQTSGSDTAKSGTSPPTARPKREPATTATATAAPIVTDAVATPTDDRWKNIPNAPITLDDFMAKFCEPRSKENRKHRRLALLAASRNKTITLPPLAGAHKHGMPYRFLVHDLLTSWPDFLNEKVDLPPLASKNAPPN